MPAALHMQLGPLTEITAASYKTLLLATFRPEKCATHIHADWTEAMNTAFALTGGPELSEAAQAVLRAVGTEFGEEAKGALALWVFFKPSFVASGQLAAWLKANQHGCLRTGQITLSIKQIIQLWNDPTAKGMIRVVFQKAGTRVTIPPGWVHQVTNLRPNLKVAWERMRRGHMSLYAVALTTIICTQMGKMADDYVRFRAALWADARRVFAEVLRRHRNFGRRLNL